MLTVDQLKTYLTYDNNIGCLIWNETKNTNQVKPGSVAGFIKKSDGYRRIKLFGKSYKASRLIWFYHNGYFPKEIDHKNGIKYDDRIENLRLATRQQQVYNTRKKKRKFQYLPKGVTFRNGKYIAYSYKNKKMVWLGRFTNIEDAAKVVKEHNTLLHGEFYREG